jgi:hypothetical protein
MAALSLRTVRAYLRKNLTASVSITMILKRVPEMTMLFFMSAAHEHT